MKNFFQVFAIICGAALLQSAINYLLFDFKTFNWIESVAVLGMVYSGLLVLFIIGAGIYAAANKK